MTQKREKNTKSQKTKEAVAGWYLDAGTHPADEVHTATVTAVTTS